jgi:hypothetical protein
MRRKVSTEARAIAGVLALTATAPALGHHGVAGLGAFGIRGPGAPLESTTSATLPAGTTLAYLKLDHAEYDKFDPDPLQPESDYADFWILGIGRGLTPWASVYAFLPYNRKADEPGGFTTSGFADISIYGQIGFKYDEGFRLVPETESLDDLEDWHMTGFFGLTFPTGNANLRDRTGVIDPGKSTGFGESSYALGMSATKQLSERWTFNQEVSAIRFDENRYDDGNRVRFGTELRANSALTFRLGLNPERESRIDFSLEAQYLDLGRDVSNGQAELATGGKMLYLVPSIRGYRKNYSWAVGIKRPVRTELNEEPLQQGGEGTEDYRLIVTFSALFGA